MKLKQYLIIILLCVSFIFTASCGNTPSANTNESMDNTDNMADNTDENNQEDVTEKPMEEEQLNQDIFGAISEIVGNMATIHLAVMPETGIPVPITPREIDLENLPDNATLNDDGSVTVELDDGSTIRRGGVSASDGPVTSYQDSGTPPDPNDPNAKMVTQEAGEAGVRNAGAVSAESRSAMSMALDYTGEEKEFIIPIGLPIYALTHGDDRNEIETEIELPNIKAGNIISVTYKEDGKTIDKIIISQVSASRPSDNNESGE